jgi:predicted amidohydrolase YtcJ
LGVTEVVDLEMTHNLPAWQRRCAKGFDSLRVHIGFYDEHLDDALALGLKSGDQAPGCNGYVLIGPYKIITDGSLGSQTAFCHDAYPDTDNKGIFVYPPRTLAQMIERGAKNDFRMAVHAIGDHANHLTLKTISEAPKLREGSTIEHAQLLNFDDLDLFKSLGLIASIQPCHLVDDRHLCHKFWPGREGRAYPFKSIVDAGIPIKLGSDAPIAPLQPWEAIAVAITRAGEGETPFCEEQIIDVETAFAASTCVSRIEAYTVECVAHIQNGKLHIREGENADLCLLKANPLECDAAGLRAMQCKGTMLGGNWTHNQLSGKQLY